MFRAGTFIVTTFSNENVVIHHLYFRILTNYLSAFKTRWPWNLVAGAFDTIFPAPILCQKPSQSKAYMMCAETSDFQAYYFILISIQIARWSSKPNAFIILYIHQKREKINVLILQKRISIYYLYIYYFHVSIDFYYSQISTLLLERFCTTLVISGNSSTKKICLNTHWYYYILRTYMRCTLP